MFAYKEVTVVDDPQQINLSRPLPLRRGQKIEILIIAENEDDALEQIRDGIAARGIDEADVQEAIQWARGHDASRI